MKKVILLSVLFFAFLVSMEVGSLLLAQNKRSETYIPPQVTYLAALPDSLQPVIVFLSNAPQLATMEVPLKPISKYIKIKNGTLKLDFLPTEKVRAAFTAEMQNYTTAQGLASDVISCSFADRRGNLWFGTYTAGVSKYDGKSFTNYTTSNGLLNNDIRSITDDREGNIWFFSDGGLGKFDGYQFSTIQGIKNPNIILENKNGDYWIGSRTGLYFYANNTIKKYTKEDGLSGNNIFDLVEDTEGNLWVGSDKGLCKFDGKQFTKVAMQNEDVSNIYLEKNGSVWAGNPSHWIHYKNDTISHQTFTKGVSPFVYKNNTGEIVVTNVPHGTTAIYKSNTISYLDKLNGYNFGVVKGVVEDKSGNSWFGTAANGVVKFAGTAFQSLTRNSFRSILQDKAGNHWFFGYCGMIKYDGENLTVFDNNLGIWASMHDDAGNIWLGTESHGLIKFDQKSFTFYNDLHGLLNNFVLCIIKDSRGNLMIGTGSGFNTFDGKSFTGYTKKQGLAGNNVASILENKPGEYWIGTDNGLSYFDGKSFTNYSISSNVKDNNIKSIIKDKCGNLWIGSYTGGVIRFDGKTFYSFTTENGLPDNVVTQVALTNEGNIVIGTNNGIALLTGFTTADNKESKDEKNSNEQKKISSQNKLKNSELKKHFPVFEIYNQKTDYPVKDVNRGQNAVFSDNAGKLWIASGSEKSGLMRFDYSALIRKTLPPQLNILSIKINNERICWNDLLKTPTDKIVPNSQPTGVASPANITEEVITFGKTLSEEERKNMQLKFEGVEFNCISRYYPVPQHLVLPFKHNKITIEFGAIEPAKPDLVRFQYKLDGYDKNWTPLSNITSADFGNIHEGIYTFQLKAISPEGVWSQPVSYTFTILPPWWRSWWAYSFYVILFIFILRLFIRWRERSLRIEKVKLEKTVLVRTAEVVAEKKEVEKQKSVVEKEKQRSDELLLNILPAEVAEELKETGTSKAKHFDEVTVMFTDFKGFTQIAENLTPTELVAEIDFCFKAFDNIIHKYNIEKIKTIGDSYMCAGGLPVANTTHVVDVVNAAMEINKFMLEHLEKRKKEGKEIFEIRIGIHTGPVVAGIVGIKKFAYDIWGDTVNTASRMESSGEAGKINISGSTYELIKNLPAGKAGKFTCTHRGKIQAKNKGEVDMYFVTD